MPDSVPPLNAGLVYEVPRTSAELPLVLAPSEGTATSLRFVTANDVKMLVLVERRSTIAETAGVRIGVASVHGRILALITLLGVLDPHHAEGASHAALLCETDGGPSFLLDGGRVRDVGVFANAGEGAVRYGDDRVARLDTTAFYRTIEKRVWERSALVVPPTTRFASGKDVLSS